ncbi:hypothetical protein FBUS_10048 [Fasciolopsis buskii]|uniref:Uncharacterized protein n=1 Tax=Fasciolopsis buskii TaxID=27845 RepID=A0A8E0VCM3_9TREM|nr:hypothetical protein FBUS_10048 [Fasciolopsis buski]
MSQPSTPASTTSVPPELRVDLTELAEDLLSYQFEELESLGLEAGSSSMDQPDLSSGRQASATDLTRRINRARSQVQRALEAARKLTSCDLDVDAQEKLLLAMCTSCITKRQLMCLLKRELSRFSKDTSASYFESP